MRWVVPLSQVDPTDPASFGSKACGLARIAAAGLRTPSARVVRTHAFETGLEESGLRRERDALVRAFLETRDEGALADRCEQLRRRLMNHRLPDGLSEELRSCLTGPGSFAVRSSANLEDGEASAFAGVFESVLWVTADDGEEAVRTCWASALTYRAWTHAMRHGLDPRDIRVGVVLQEMVEADLAGVLFTRHPSGAKPEQVQLAFTTGVGDTLMTGEIEGSTWTLGRDGAILGDGADPRELDRLPLGEILEAGQTLERLCGHPQDVEWALEGNTLHLLQTRPITTIEPVRKEPIRWTRELAEERFPKPISPLGWSMLQKFLAQNVDSLRTRFGIIAENPGDVARTIDNYVYSNDGFFSIRNMRFNPVRQLRFLPPLLAQLPSLVGLAPTALLGRPGSSLKRLLTTRLFRGFIFVQAREILAGWDTHLEEILAEVDALRDVDLAVLSDDELWTHKERIDELGARYMEPDLAIYVVKMALAECIARLAEDVVQVEGQLVLAHLTSGVVENVTSVRNRKIEGLYTVIAEDPEILELLADGRYRELLDTISGAGAEALASFMATEGHATDNWDVGQATWEEEPEILLGILRTFAQRGEIRGVEANRERQIAQYEAARRWLLEALSGTRWLADFLVEALGLLHSFMRIDEEHGFYCSRFFLPMRRAYLEAGARLSRRGVIGEAEDVFFLPEDVVLQALTSERPFPRRYLVQANRRSFLASGEVTPPHSFLGQIPSSEAIPGVPKNGGVLRGTGASPGVAEGDVRVLETARDAAELQPGEVLVATSPKPSWTPLFAVAAGAVTSTGSTLSHGCISAREYGLPLVVGVPDVARTLRTGQRVRVDGTRGTVTPLDPGVGTRGASSGVATAHESGDLGRITTLLFDLDGTLVDMRPRLMEFLFMSRACFRFARVIRPWRFRRAFWEAAEEMQAHVSDATNYQVFLGSLARHASCSEEELHSLIQICLERDFSRLAPAVRPIQGARETLLFARSAGYRIVLATNPVFPTEAVRMRLEWGGLGDIPFSLITSSEVMTRTKPAVEYYLEVLDRLGADPRDCLMVGNDLRKDLPASEAGIRTFVRPEGALANLSKEELLALDSRIDYVGDFGRLRMLLGEHRKSEITEVT